MRLRSSGSFSSFERPVDLTSTGNNNNNNNNNLHFNSTYRFDRLFLQRFYRLLRLLFQSSPGTPWFAMGKDARQHSVFWLYMTFLFLACGSEWLVYYVGLIPSRFYTILTAKDRTGFLTFIFPCLLLILGIAAGKALMNYTGGLLALKIRRLLTNHLHDRYIQSKIMYTLILDHNHVVDNPDQRITQDIDKLAETMHLILEKLVLSPMLVVLYTWQCWSVAGLLGPMLIYSYFILGSLISRRFIQPIVTTVFYKELQEGNFRFLHVRLRQFAESIAFSKGEWEEKQRANASLDTLLTYQRSIVNKQLPLQLANQTFSYFGSILSYLIVAIPIFSGAFDDKDSGELSGIISKNSFVSMYLIYLFSTIIDQSDKISVLAGYVARIGELLEVVDDIDNTLDSVQLDSVSQDSSDVILFDKVTLVSPRGKPIVTDLSLEITDGQHLVLMGPNGSGKSSILRALAGLWSCSKGRIHVPHLKHGKDLIFLPQAPYLIQGSLRDQLTYPSLSSSTTVTDADVRMLLSQVRLTHLEHMIDSFDTSYGIEWDKMLSPGEQQRLVFARLLYWKPRFAVLDEATSAMDIDTESRLYQLAKDANITLISVSHHPGIVHYHHRKLVLDGDGHFTLQDI
ncbi:ATP-binding cassette sub-family D member 4 [Halteromyces radiatus]|uniref:ATP-binding cassette sub-family D member 4 n=1 Tax=Halteromyces radiatus TaxID=101107 RepID=UPI00221F4D97|nr:ATP-binding cassette sub-family D member 4 [Halteromyces radiatus]KAI8098532.1 ATP-binding cassette sub-family D member 4 [Halteromyces radiatus]